MRQTRKGEWHHWPSEQILRLLDTDAERGLTSGEAARRRQEFGPNAIASHRGRSPWKLLLGQIHQPLIYILLAATAITVWLGEWVDASVIFGVVLINAVVGYLQEAKAEKAIDALSRLVVTEATVVRDGRRQRMNAVELVPGDVVQQQTKNRVKK